VPSLPIALSRNGALYRRWDAAPRPAELPGLATYRRGLSLYRELWLGGYTMLGARRGRTLHRLAAQVAREGVPGAIVDCGVWNGGSTILMAVAAPDRDVWAFDSFAGLPTPSEVDGRKSFEFAGDCVGSETRLREGIDRYADAERLHVRAGWFEDTIADAAKEIGQVSVLHCDGDWYDSVRLTLEVFYPQVSPEGFVVIDDYGTWPGAKLATDEYRRAVHDRARLRRIDHTGRYWRKSRRSVVQTDRTLSSRV
jgi:O-methyltransferase